MFHTLSYCTEHVTRKTEKTIIDLTGVFCLCELHRDSSLHHAVYRLLGFHRWLPRAEEEVTEEHTVVLSLSKDLHLFCKFYRDLQIKKAQNHCFYTITITWKEISGIFQIGTFKNDSAPSSMMHNYIFRVALLQPVYRTRAGRVQWFVFSLFNGASDFTVLYSFILLWRRNCLFPKVLIYWHLTL